jgi:hypothetical protein
LFAGVGALFADGDIGGRDGGCLLTCGTEGGLFGGWGCLFGGTWGCLFAGGGAGGVGFTVCSFVIFASMAFLCSSIFPYISFFKSNFTSDTMSSTVERFTASFNCSGL